MKLTEKQFQEQVIDLAHIYHWKVAHFRPAQTSKGWRTPVGADGKGFPDLVLARKGQVLFIELKSDDGKVTEEQREWLNELDGILWRPQDLETIAKVVLR